MNIGKCYERKPSELVKEARKAYECGLYIASLSVLVTIPDICAHLVRESWPENDKAAERFDERWWCATYLGLPSEVSDCCVTKREDKSPDEIDGVLSRLVAEERFTASDFSQLRNAVLHAGSALVEGFGDKFSPYHAIGICITDSDSQLILGTGVTSAPGPGGKETDCSFDATLSLNAMLSRMEEAVQRFLSERPQFDVEVGKWSSIKYGIIDMRTLEPRQTTAE